MGFGVLPNWDYPEYSLERGLGSADSLEDFDCIAEDEEEEPLTLRGTWVFFISVLEICL